MPILIDKLRHYIMNFLKKHTLLIKCRIIPPLLLCFILLPQGSWAHDHPAYSHDAIAKTSNSDWMSFVPRDRLLSELSLPGTHGSMALHGSIASLNVKNQTMSFTTQLESGLRAFDMRVHHTKDRLELHHGAFSQHTFFDDDVLKIAAEFLANHPSETLIMRVKEDHDPTNNTRTLNETFAYHKNLYPDLMWDPTSNNSDNPTLDEIRGKIVILTQGFDTAFGIEYRNLRIQDDYHLDTNWDLHDKWTAIKDHLVKTNNSARRKIHVNFLSGAGLAFPYFVASGHVTPGTGAPRLSTAHTTPGWNNKYPDFPRVSCWLRICTIAFEGMNTLTYQMIKNHNIKHTGIIFADFPGPALIEAIIELNSPISANIDDLLNADLVSEGGHWSDHGNGTYTATYEPLPNEESILKFSFMALDNNSLLNLTVKKQRSGEQVESINFAEQSRSDAYYHFYIEPGDTLEPLDFLLTTTDYREKSKDLISHIAIKKIDPLPAPSWWKIQTPELVKTAIIKEDQSKPLIWHVATQTAILPKDAIKNSQAWDEDQRIVMTAFADQIDEKLYYYLNHQTLSEDPQNLSRSRQTALALSIPTHATTKPRLKNPNIAISGDTVILSYTAYYENEKNKKETRLEYIYGRIKYLSEEDQLYIDWSDQPHQFLTYSDINDKTYPYLSASMTAAKEIVLVGSLNQSLYAKSGKVNIDPKTQLPDDNLKDTDVVELIKDTSELNIRSVSIKLLSEEQQPNQARGVIAVRKRSGGDKHNVLYVHSIRATFVDTENSLVTNNISFNKASQEYDKGIYPMVTTIDQAIQRGGQDWFPVLELHKDSKENVNALYVNYGELPFEDTGTPEALKITGGNVANMATSNNKGFSIGTIGGTNTYAAISATPDGNILLSQVCEAFDLDKSGIPDEASYICNQWSLFSNPNVADVN